MLDVGDKIPTDAIPDHTGTPHSLRDFDGAWLVVFFYPKDFTSG